jgi:ketosteroid isomerase-like protein
MQNNHDPLESFSGMLRSAIGDFLRPDAESFLEMFAEDGVLEFPYAPPGIVTRLDGRAELASHLQGFPEILQIDRMTAPVVHRTMNPEVVILEFGCVGHGVRTGEPYDQRYISVITVKDGLIVHYADYWNPLIALQAVGGVDALRAALGAGGDHA